MDREAWHAAIRGVTKSWTRLNDWTELKQTKIKFCWLASHHPLALLIMPHISFRVYLLSVSILKFGACDPRLSHAVHPIPHWFRDRYVDPFRTHKAQWKLKEGPWLFSVDVKPEGCGHSSEKLEVAILGSHGRVFVLMDSTQSQQSPEMKRETMSWTQPLSLEVLSDLSLDGLVNKTTSPCVK